MPDYCMDCETPLMGDEEFYCTVCLFQAELILTSSREQSIWDILPE